MSIQVRSYTYRREPGFTVSGKTSRGGRIRIFCRTEVTARAIQAAYKLADRDETDREINRLLMSETP